MKDEDWSAVREGCAARPAWRTALPLVEEALAEGAGGFTPDDVLRGIIEGRMQLWLGERCAAVTEILHWPRRKVLSTFLAAGDVKEMQAMRPGVEAFGRAVGCEAAIFYGRTSKRARALSGWAAVSGYEPRWTTCFKEL